MKFELKTDNDHRLNTFAFVSRTVFFLAIIIIFCNASWKLGNISRHYQINHFCRLLNVEKSSSNFKSLSTLSNLKSKQEIWQFCREIVK